MKRDKIKELVIDELSAVSGCDKDLIEEKSHLENDLGLDSLDRVEIIIDLENAFAISISDEELGEFEDKRVGDVIDLIETKIS